jgi:hypothetical protein
MEDPGLRQQQSAANIEVRVADYCPPSRTRKPRLNTGVSSSNKWFLALLLAAATQGHVRTKESKAKQQQRAAQRGN